MTYLPARPDLEQLRHQAKDLLREATRGAAEAVARIDAVSDRVTLASAQLAIAREYGFASWPKLKREVERREVLNRRDLDRLSSLLTEDPDLAVSLMVNWADHRLGASPAANTCPCPTACSTTQSPGRIVGGVCRLSGPVISASGFSGSRRNSCVQSLRIGRLLSPKGFSQALATSKP
jgi:hypothetical protein